MSAPSSAPALAWVPRGVRLDEPAFAARHRMLTVVALAQLPVVLLVGLLRDTADTAMWTGVALAAAGALSGSLTGAASQAVRAALVGFSLMMVSTTLLLVTDGQTDMHIHFYVMLALVALYQTWAPFLVAILLVAGHHFILGTVAPDAVFADHAAQENPLGYAVLHAGLLLAMAVGLAVGWRFAEDADRARRAQQRHAEEQAAAQAASQAELAEERSRAAADAALQLAERERTAAALADRLVVLEEGGDRLTADVSTATDEMGGLLSAIEDIARAATAATTTAHEADSEIRSTSATMEQLVETLHSVQQIAETIAAIAGQTNLLALNATIEAARANEAGKGFAVVAGEVKNLAHETTEATDRIREVVSTVRNDTGAAMRSIGRIRDVIAQVVDAQTTIAAAVEQQSMTTTQARHAIGGAAEEAGRIAEELKAIVALQTHPA